MHTGRKEESSTDENSANFSKIEGDEGVNDAYVTEW
jgi:hypothetical protein